MQIKRTVKEGFADRKFIARFPLVVFVAIWLFQFIEITILSKGRFVGEITLESIGMLILSLVPMLIFQMIPFLVISAYCEYLIKKEKATIEILVKMLSMTVPLGVSVLCMLLFPLFMDMSSHRSGWAMGLGFLALTGIPLILLLGWLLGKVLYDTYFSKEQAHTESTKQ